VSRFSFNQATAPHWPMPDLIAGCTAAGVGHVGLWREQVAEYGLAKTRQELDAAGLGVSTLCRGGFFNRPGWLEENRRAIDEAAALGAPVLVLVSGGLPPGSRDLGAARAHVAQAVAELVPDAAQARVTLAVEPLHPMYAADRCVINTFEQAMAIAAPHPVGVVGVVVDTYHLWWDERAPAQIAQAGARIASFQLADWTTPLPAGVLTGRALPGDGCIDFAPLWMAVAAAGYAAPVEIEVFNAELWLAPGDEILRRCLTAWDRACAASGVHSGD
jgi:sugar phosphate isomerase/epimerase